MPWKPCIDSQSCAGIKVYSRFERALIEVHETSRKSSVSDAVKIRQKNSVEESLTLKFDLEDLTLKF